MASPHPHTMRPGDKPRCVICDEPLTAIEKAAGGVCHRPKCRLTQRAHSTRGGAQCVICSAPLSDHQRLSGGICARQACRHEQLSRDLKERERQQQIVVKQCAERVCRRVAGKHNLSDSLPVFVVPHNGRSITNLPETRRRQLRDHLQEVISRAMVQWFGPKSTGESRHDPPSEPVEQSELRILWNACATCAGQCCWVGRDNAFLDEETIRRYMKHNPTARPRHILEHYMSYVGNKIYHNSCFYHGEFGCTLPRDMRARICNEFLCVLLKHMLGKIEKDGADQVFAVSISQQKVTVPVEDQLIQRVALIDNDQFRMLEFDLEEGTAETEVDGSCS